MADEGYQPFPDISAWTAVPFDPTTYDQYAALLEEARANATEEAREHAVRTAIRYAGTDTGAIEGLYTTDRGFTRTVAIEAANWEAAANERGPNAAAIIKDQIEAYEWVLDLATQERPITEHVVRELHAMLCRSQENYVVHTAVGAQERPLPKGRYKEFPNNPTSLATGQIHHYAPPDLVGPEMARLVVEMSSPEYAAAHPVVQAAYVHYALAAIHPFPDGNGRVSRALASVPLYRALRLPLLVLADRRDEYLDALGAADSGNLAAFVQFVAERVRETTDLVSLTMRVGRSADRHQSLAALATASGQSAADVEAAAAAALELIRSELQKQVEDIEWPFGVSLHVLTQPAMRLPTPVGFRLPAASNSSMGIALLWSVIGRTTAIGRIAVLVPEEPVEPVTLLAVSDYDRAVPLDLPLRDLRPEVREVVRIKIATWATHVLDREFERIAAARP